MGGFIERPGNGRGYRFDFAVRLLERMGTASSDVVFRGQKGFQVGTVVLVHTVAGDQECKSDPPRGAYELMLDRFRNECVRNGFVADERVFGKGRSVNDEVLQSLAQHHRLPTALLDWSESLSVALLFAFDGCEGGALTSKYVSVWCLNHQLFEDGAVRVLRKEGAYRGAKTSDLLREHRRDRFRLVNHYVLDNRRVRRQKGVLTWSRRGEALDDYVRRNNDVFRDGTLMRVDIRASEQETALRRLSLRGTDPAEVMGDRDGISMAIYNDLLRFASSSARPEGDMA